MPRRSNFTIFSKSYKKTREMQKESILFFSFTSASKFGGAKVTKSRVQYKIKSFIFMPGRSNFTIFRKVRKNEIRTKQSHSFFYADCTVACSSLACFIMTLIRYDLCGCRALFVQSCGVISTGSLHTLCRGFAHFVQMPCTLCANVLHSLCNASALFLRSSAFENTPCSTSHKGLVSETNETGITYQTLQIIEIIS